MFRIVELIIAIVGASIITRILTIRQRVRQEKSAADKAETEVKADQIQNIQDIVDKVYKPTIETLTAKVDELQRRVDELERENAQLRAAYRADHPESIPSRRGENGKSQARAANGRFERRDA